MRIDGGRTGRRGKQNFRNGGKYLKRRFGKMTARTSKGTYTKRMSISHLRPGIFFLHPHPLFLLLYFFVFLDSGLESNLNPQDLLLFDLQLFVQYLIFFYLSFSPWVAGHPFLRCRKEKRTRERRRRKKNRRKGKSKSKFIEFKIFKS